MADLRIISKLIRLVNKNIKFGKSIQDTFSFVSWRKSYNNKGVMASIDVSPLFTNIPLDETLDICINKLYSSETPPPFHRKYLEIYCTLLRRTLSTMASIMIKLMVFQWEAHLQMFLKTI